MHTCTHTHTQFGSKSSPHYSPKAQEADDNVPRAAWGHDPHSPTKSKPFLTLNAVANFVFLFSFLSPFFPSYLHSFHLSPLPSQTLMIVEAEYDCDPDHRDELGFKEGERIVVTERLNRDWLVGSPTCVKHWVVSLVPRPWRGPDSEATEWSYWSATLP